MRKTATDTDVKRREKIKHNLSTTTAMNFHCCFHISSSTFILLNGICFFWSATFGGYFIRRIRGSQQRKSVFDRPCTSLGFIAFKLRLTTIVDTTDKAIVNMTQLKYVPRKHKFTIRSSSSVNFDFEYTQKRYSVRIGWHCLSNRVQKNNKWK